MHWRGHPSLRGEREEEGPARRGGASGREVLTREKSRPIYGGGLRGFKEDHCGDAPGARRAAAPSRCVPGCAMLPPVPAIRGLRTRDGPLEL